MDETALKSFFSSCRFTKNFMRLNSLSSAGDRFWVFHPGMGFGSDNIWWKGDLKRKTPHEGVDLCAYQDSQGFEKKILPGMLVSALASGEVRQIIPDFLGMSIFISHPIVLDDRELFSVYGHVTPCPGIANGQRVLKDSAIASVADASGSRSPVPPHLHLSIALVSRSIPRNSLGWKILADNKSAVLLDPLLFMDCL